MYVWCGRKDLTRFRGGVKYRSSGTEGIYIRGNYCMKTKAWYFFIWIPFAFIALPWIIGFQVKKYERIHNTRIPSRWRGFWNCMIYGVPVMLVSVLLGSFTESLILRWIFFYCGTVLWAYLQVRWREKNMKKSLKEQKKKKR